MADQYALDASALLCLLNEEEGAERVETSLDSSVMSAVNYSEVVAKIVERGGTPELAAAMLDPLHLQIIDFDRAQAVRAGELRRVTRSAGLSLGDRACLSLAVARGIRALTTDRAWADLELNVEIELLR